MIIHDIEQRSEAWYQLRTGMPTASMFSKMVTSKGKILSSLPEYALTLAAAIYSGKNLDSWKGNEWTERGRELEENARKLYEFRNHKVKEIGFITDDQELWGCSPDGIVGNNGMVEFKCLKAENHIKAIMYFSKYNKCLPYYTQQCQGQMLISERNWCDLVFYHPEFPLLIIRQEPDKNVTSGLLEARQELLIYRNEIVETLNSYK